MSGNGIPTPLTTQAETLYPFSMLEELNTASTAPPPLEENARTSNQESITIVSLDGSAPLEIYTPAPIIQTEELQSSESEPHPSYMSAIMTAMSAAYVGFSNLSAYGKFEAICGGIKFCVNRLMRTKVVYKALGGLKAITLEIGQESPADFIKQLETSNWFFKTFNFINNGVKFLYYLNELLHPNEKQNRIWILSQVILRVILFAAYILDFIAESTPLNFITSALTALADIGDFIYLTHQIKKFEVEKLKHEEEILKILRMSQAELARKTREERAALLTQLTHHAKEFHLATTGLKKAQSDRYDSLWFLTMSGFGIATTILFITNPYIGLMLASALAITKLSHMLISTTAKMIKKRALANKVEKSQNSKEPSQAEINASINTIALNAREFSGVSCTTDAIDLFKVRLQAFAGQQLTTPLVKFEQPDTETPEEIDLRTRSISPSTSENSDFDSDSIVDSDYADSRCGTPFHDSTTPFKTLLITQQISAQPQIHLPSETLAAF